MEHYGREYFTGLSSAAGVGRKTIIVRALERVNERSGVGREIQRTPQQNPIHRNAFPRGPALFSISRTIDRLTFGQDECNDETEYRDPIDSRYFCAPRRPQNCYKIHGEKLPETFKMSEAGGILHDANDWKYDY